MRSLLLSQRVLNTAPLSPHPCVGAWSVPRASAFPTDVGAHTETRMCQSRRRRLALLAHTHTMPLHSRPAQHAPPPPPAFLPTAPLRHRERRRRKTKRGLLQSKPSYNDGHGKSTSLGATVVGLFSIITIIHPVVCEEGIVLPECVGHGWNGTCVLACCLLCGVKLVGWACVHVWMSSAHGRTARALCCC
jgi:hypothetical protein